MKNAGDVPKGACLAVYAIIAVGFSVAIVRTEITAPVTVAAAPSLPATPGAVRSVPAAPMLAPVQAAGEAEANAAATPAVPAPVADDPADATIRISGGDHLYALGDSVLLGAREHLKESIPGIQVDAAVGRQASHGLKSLHEWQGKLDHTSTVLVHLGTNGYINEGQFRELLTELAGCKSVILVNVHADRRWTEPNNELIRRMTQEFPNTRLIDWSRVSAGRPDFFVKDGIHLTRRGILALTSQIRIATGGEPLPEAPAQEPPRRLARKGANGDGTADAEAPAHAPRHGKTARAAAHKSTPAAASDMQAGKQAMPGV